MNTYTVRVELHDNAYNTFKILHYKMQNQGFSRLIVSDTGVTYHLPRAIYNISTNKTGTEVLEMVQKAIRETGKTAEILVTEAVRWTWSGLTLA